MRVRRSSPLASLEEALAWLCSVAQELTDAPLRLHEHAVQPADLLGAPRMSTPFMHRLSDSAFATRPAPRTVQCPAEHPARRIGEARCAMCDDTREWTTTTDVYVRPLAAALSALSRGRSRLRPHPHAIAQALLRESCDPARAALRLGADVAPDDRRFLSAVRALYDHFSYTAMSPARRAA